MICFDDGDKLRKFIIYDHLNIAEYSINLISPHSTGILAFNINGAGNVLVKFNINNGVITSEKIYGVDAYTFTFVSPSRLKISTTQSTFTIRSIAGFVC